MLRYDNGQMDIYDNLMEDLVREDHPYRKVAKLIDFKSITKPLEKLYNKDRGAKGYPVDVGFKCLFIQFWEDLSDREMEVALKDTVPIRWFCGFKLFEKTPDHSYFGELRKRIGVGNLADLFNKVTESLTNQGLISNVFTFVDSATVTSKINIWEARDKARREGIDKLNNNHIGRYTKDKDARFGCKGKNKFWLGYKQHHSVDMRHGFIKKVVITPANTPDFRVFPELCPSTGMVFADKGYDFEPVYEKMGEEVASGIIKCNNRKDKNRELDRWRSGVRMPYEGIHNQFSRYTRYCGEAKTLFQKLMEGLVVNIKRLIEIAKVIPVAVVS